MTGTYSQCQGTQGEEARWAWLIWADLPEGERQEWGLEGEQTERRHEGITSGWDSLSKNQGGPIVRGSLLKSAAWQGEKIQVRKMGGKGQINRVYQAVQRFHCLTSEFTPDLGSSQSALSVVEHRSRIMKAEFLGRWL